MGMHQAIIKQKRLDARRLTALARRLRDEANQLAREDRLNKAIKEGSFLDKPAAVDNKIILTPEREEITF